VGTVRTRDSPREKENAPALIHTDGPDAKTLRSAKPCAHKRAAHERGRDAGRKTCPTCIAEAGGEIPVPRNSSRQRQARAVEYLITGRLAARSSLPQQPPGRKKIGS
jgi:hypothetical protein